MGQDRTVDCCYFGSVDSFSVAADFTKEQLDDFSIRKEIVFRAENVTIQELNRIERDWIARLNSCDPALGYNRTGVKRKICTTLWREE